jgi:two-component system OmpR family response regulator
MRILVVEDDAVLAAALTRALNQSAYAVDLVGDGEAANDALATTTYDLVVLDIALPRLDGLAVLRRLRDRRVQTPVLMLTARDTLEDRVLGLDSGADDYMTKLFGFGDDVGSNAIEVYVHRVRRKLEPLGIEIRTVRGMGYLLDKVK